MGHSYRLWNVGHTQASVAERQSRHKAKVWAAAILSATRGPVELRMTEEVRNRQKVPRGAEGPGLEQGDGGWSPYQHRGRMAQPQILKPHGGHMATSRATDECGGRWRRQPSGLSGALRLGHRDEARIQRIS